MANNPYTKQIVPKRKWSKENEDFGAWIDETIEEATYTNIDDPLVEWDEITATTPTWS